MTSKPKLTKTTERAYKVLLDGAHIGSVVRTGTLPSCTRWWPAGPNSESYGLSSATRKAAVASVLAMHEEMQL